MLVNALDGILYIVNLYVTAAPRGGQQNPLENVCKLAVHHRAHQTQFFLFKITCIVY